MSRLQVPELPRAASLNLDIMEPSVGVGKRCSLETFKLSINKEDSSQMSKRSKETGRENFSTMQSLLLMTNDTTVRNLFGYYDFGNWLDDVKVDLFLRLDLLNMHNNDACRYGPSEECFRAAKNYIRICEAFLNFFFYAEDPLCEELELECQLARLYESTACDRHEASSQSCRRLPAQRFDALMIWREEQFEAPRQSTECSDRTTPPAQTDRWSRLPKMFSAQDLKLSRRGLHRRAELDMTVQETDAVSAQMVSTRPARMRRTLSTSSSGSTRADSIFDDASRESEVMKTRRALEHPEEYVSTLPYHTDNNEVPRGASRKSIWGLGGWNSKRKSHAPTRVRP